MKLPCTSAALERLVILMPSPALAEMMFRAAVVVPPMVVADDCVDRDAVAEVDDRLGAGGIEADEVPLDDGPDALELDGDPILIVAGDDIARAGGRAADQDVRRTTDGHSVADVGQRLRAALVEPDEVALHHDRGRLGDHDTIGTVAGDDVAGRGRGAADRVADAPSIKHAVAEVVEGQRVTR